MQILALETYTPIKGEKYFVDTNVWFWTTYVASKGIPLANAPEDYQVMKYPKFIERVLQAGGILCHSPLSLAELANVIENAELNFYKRKIGNSHFEKKAFRRIASERKKVIEEINSAWDQVSRMSKSIDTKMDNNFFQNSKKLFVSGLIDPMDSFFIQIMRDQNIDYIVSDDGDYSTLNQQIMLTANSRALKTGN